MKREALIRRLAALGIPCKGEDLEKLLPQWQIFVDNLERFPDLDPLADEPAAIFHPEVSRGDR